MTNQARFSVKEITLLALLSALLFVQEETFTFIPGLQFTVFLIVVYSKVLGLAKTAVIVLIHVFLDNVVMGTFNAIYTPIMLLGWMIIPLTLCTVFRKIDSSIPIAFLGALYSFVYCWLYFIPDCLVYKMNFVARFSSDVVFEIIMAAFTFISLLWLYAPVSKALRRLMQQR